MDALLLFCLFVYFIIIIFFFGLLTSTLGPGDGDRHCLPSVMDGASMNLFPVDVVHLLFKKKNLE